MEPRKNTNLYFAVDPGPEEDGFVVVRNYLHPEYTDWRKPDANCMRGASSEERMKWKRERGMPISINDQVGKGSLNPAWVEILMGFPLGWTDIDCDEPEPWPGWPAMMGEAQCPYEPPRTGTGIPNRAARLKALGNAVVPAQAYPFFEAIKVIEEVTK